MTQIAVPAFKDALDQLVNLALEFPDCTSRHAYLAAKQDGTYTPHCILGAAMVAQGADLHILPQHNTKYMLRAFRFVYDFNNDVSLFDPNDHLVFWLYMDVQAAIDHSGLPWRPALIKGLTKFLRKHNSPTGGFLVQTHGNHKDLADRVTRETLAAIAILN